jgi:hypothetical protein
MRRNTVGRAQRAIGSGGFDMRTMDLERLARSALLAVIFAAGYVCGAVGNHAAEAQLGNIAGDVLKQAAGTGTLGVMGTALVEAEGHVSGLQKNIDSLKKVKAALGG